MKKLKAMDAITIKQFDNIVKHQNDIYWRYYLMWSKHSDLADEDPKEFIKLESKSGSAMWDDPPEGWSERDLFIWSKGYVHGRSVECSNISGMMEHLSNTSDRLINKDYGFRDGMPSIKQIERLGCVFRYWVLQCKDTSEDSFIPYYPIFYILEVKDGKIRYLDDATGKWKIYLKKEMRKIISSMPVDENLIPVSWNMLK